MGGMDRVATLIKAVRAERGDDKVLLLDGGDTWQGSWTSLQTKGQDMVDVMHSLKVDAMTSHWEFTYGADRVKEIADKFADRLSGAEHSRQGMAGAGIQGRSKTFVKGGAKIVVIGQAFPRTPISNPRWMIPDWEFGLRERELAEEVEKARSRAAPTSSYCCRTTVSTSTARWPSRVKGIDVVLTAHTHDAMPGVIMEGQTIIIASGSHGKFVSRLDLDIKDKKVAGYRYKLMPVFSDAIAPDATDEGDDRENPRAACESAVAGAGAERIPACTGAAISTAHSTILSAMPCCRSGMPRFRCRPASVGAARWCLDSRSLSRHCPMRRQ